MLHYFYILSFSFFSDRISQARRTPERGGPTLEQAIWAGVIFVAAVALGAVVVSAITSRQDLIY